MMYSCDVPRNISELGWDQTRRFIIDKLVEDLANPEKSNTATQFLLQHGYWQIHPYAIDSASTIQYIACYDCDLPWYDVEDLVMFSKLESLGTNVSEDTGDTDVTICSWKGNHPDLHRLDYGNLDYDGPFFNFTGTCWTRGL